MAIEHLENRYPDAEARNGQSTWLIIEQRILLNTVSSFSFGLDHYREHANETSLSNEMIALQIGYQREHRKGVTTTWQLRIASTLYDGQDPLFGIQRNDTSTLASLSLAKRNWRLWDFSTYPGHHASSPAIFRSAL